MTPTQLNKSIMRRVYAVWFLRKITSPFYVKMYIMMVLVFQLVRSVSVSDVANNIGNVKVSNMINYMLHSFAQTEPAVQIYSILFAMIGVWLLYERRRSAHLAS